jgi:hypothetical protein
MKVHAVVALAIVMLSSVDAPALDKEDTTAKACANAPAARLLLLEKGEMGIEAKSGDSYGGKTCDRYVVDVVVTSQSTKKGFDSVEFVVRTPPPPPVVFECPLAVGVADLYVRSTTMEEFKYFGRMTLQGRFTSEGCVMEWDSTGTYTGPFLLPDPGKGYVFRIAASYELIDTQQSVTVGVTHTNLFPVPTGPAPLP